MTIEPTCQHLGYSGNCLRRSGFCQFGNSRVHISCACIGRCEDYQPECTIETNH